MSHLRAAKNVDAAPCAGLEPWRHLPGHFSFQIFSGIFDLGILDNFSGGRY